MLALLIFVASFGKFSAQHKKSTENWKSFFILHLGTYLSHLKRHGHWYKVFALAFLENWKLKKRCKCLQFPWTLRKQMCPNNGGFFFFFLNSRKKRMDANISCFFKNRKWKMNAFMSRLVVNVNVSTSWKLKTIDNSCSNKCHNKILQVHSFILHFWEKIYFCYKNVLFYTCEMLTQNYTTALITLRYFLKR